MEVSAKHHFYRQFDVSSVLTVSEWMFYERFNVHRLIPLTFWAAREICHLYVNNLVEKSVDFLGLSDVTVTY